MQRSTRIGSVITIVSAMALGAALRFSYAYRDDATSPRNVAPLPKIEIAHRASSPLQTLTTTGVPAPDVRPSTLRPQLFVAPDYHSYAVDALARPTEGGTLYGVIAFDACDVFRRAARFREASVRSEIARTSSMRADRAALIAKWLARCAAFTDSELRFDDPSLLLPIGRLRSDPLFMALVEAALAKQALDADRMRKTLQHLIELREPLLFSISPDVLRTMRRVGEEHASGVWFKGEWLEGDEARAFFDVLPVALCMARQPCKLTIDLELACANAGTCPDRSDYPDLLRRKVDSDAEWQRSVALAQRVGAALASGTASDFLDPPDAR